MSTKPSKKKSPVKRDEDFEELDNELEAALQALASVNERTANLLQRVEQGTELIPDEGAATVRVADTASPPVDEASRESTGSIDDVHENTDPADPAVGA